MHFGSDFTQGNRTCRLNNSSQQTFNTIHTRNVSGKRGKHEVPGRTRVQVQCAGVNKSVEKKSPTHEETAEASL